MFSGIVFDAKPLVNFKVGDHDGTISVDLGPDAALYEGLQQGASVSINGVCLTVAELSDSVARFDIVASTLRRTNLGGLSVGQLVNVERSLSQGAENGGHEVSGHVDFTAAVQEIVDTPHEFAMTLILPNAQMRYFFPRGYIALNGVSLTIAELSETADTIRVWLIPETLRRTNLRGLRIGDPVNVEIPRDTQVLVDTVARTIDSALAKHLEPIRANIERLLSQGLSS